MAIWEAFRRAAGRACCRRRPPTGWFWTRLNPDCPREGRETPLHARGVGRHTIRISPSSWPCLLLAPAPLVWTRLKSGSPRAGAEMPLRVSSGPVRNPRFSPDFGPWLRLISEAVADTADRPDRSRCQSLRISRLPSLWSGRVPLRASPKPSGTSGRRSFRPPSRLICWLPLRAPPGPTRSRHRSPFFAPPSAIRKSRMPVTPDLGAVASTGRKALPALSRLQQLSLFDDAVPSLPERDKN